jgi:CubicO group peptidase (beta-lactamase class C family)
MKTFARWVAVVFGLSMLAQATAASAMEAEKTEAIDRLLRLSAEAMRLPSVVLVIDRGGEAVYEKAIGHSDLSHRIETSVDTAYAIGSITKSFTGLAIAQLAHEGRVDLEETVAHYLPSYKGPGAAATVAQLLTHSSGIPNYTNEIPGIREQIARNAFTRDQMVDLFQALPLNFQPGSQFSYSNSGYYLLGLIIEKVTGESYYDYLDRTVFSPLGLTRTYSGDRTELIPNLAHGYEVGPDGFLNAPPWHHLVPFSAGSLVSTAHDVIRYRRGVFHSDAIPQGVRDILLATTTLAGGAPNVYTLGGLVLSEPYGMRKISHAGDIWGYASNHSYYPEQDVTIVLLTNRAANTPALASIEAKIARIVFDIPQPTVRNLQLDKATLDRYVGTYRVHPYRIGFANLEFVERDGKLLMCFERCPDDFAGAVPLLAQGDALFRAPFDDEWTFRFISGENGVSQLVSQYRDGTIYGERVAD